MNTVKSKRVPKSRTTDDTNARINRVKNKYYKQVIQRKMWMKWYKDEEFKEKKNLKTIFE